MYCIFRLDDEGHPLLLDTCANLEEAGDLVDYWSECLPHSYVDYVYKDWMPH